MGVVEWIPSYNSPSDLIDAVDKALYKAKHTKGERIAVGKEKPIKTKTPKK
jgi:PleD family two-component response regulator